MLHISIMHTMLPASFWFSYIYYPQYWWPLFSQQSRGAILWTFNDMSTLWWTATITTVCELISIRILNKERMWW